MLFPYATCNLRKYMAHWQCGPPKRGPTLRLLEQLRGLADALRYIHNLSKERNPQPQSQLAVPGKETAWHHDLKPDNIIFFSGQDSSDEDKIAGAGTLRIADFGSGKINTLRSKSINTRSPTGTPTYGPPVRSTQGATSRPYDVWSMGCAFLELLVWALFGSDDVRVSVSEGTVGAIHSHQRAVMLRLGVTEQIHDLQKEIDRRSHMPFSQVLHVVQQMLNINPNARADAVHVWNRLDQILDRAMVDFEDEGGSDSESVAHQGFSYGLLDTLNKHFQNTLGISKARSSGLQAAYFGAYPLASLGHANWVLRHFGYKAVFIWGLSLYGIGALIAWPCLLHRSFGGFCAAIFIIGNGLGSLETAANPYLAVCGPPRYSEIRINLAQAFNAVGTVIAPVLGSYAFFKDVGDDGASLQNVQWVYLAIACFVFLLAVVFYFSTIPEITDADMMFQAQETHVGAAEKPFRKQYRLFHAAIAQFCYTGAQIAIASYFINYAVETRKGTSSATGAIYLAIAQGCFAIGRFSGSFFMNFVKPRWVFLIYLTCVIIFNSAATTQRHATGIAMLSLTLFFESVCFPTIVALGMRGLGRHTKRGSGLIVAGVSGGAAVPPILGAAADAIGTGRAMVVPVCFMVAAWTYALAVNFVPQYRDPADKIGVSTLGVADEGEVSRTSSGKSDGRSEGEGAVEDGDGGREEVRRQSVVNESVRTAELCNKYSKAASLSLTPKKPLAWYQRYPQVEVPCARGLEGSGSYSMLRDGNTRDVEGNLPPGITSELAKRPIVKTRFLIQSAGV
ncbi:MAG: hypothetical protein Q9170_003134 [Blastenia crenularia]